jgi:hypothetical protein
MTAENSAPSPADWLEYQKWLDGIVSLQEAAELRDVHPDTMQKEAREAGELLRRSEGRLGVRRRFALLIKDQRTTTRRRRAVGSG